MHIDRDTSEQDLVIRIWFGCLLEWQCQENKFKKLKKINCLVHKALTHRFLFLFLVKNKNITTTRSGRVITKFLLLLAMYYSSLTRAFVSTPKFHSLTRSWMCFPVLQFYNTTSSTTTIVLSWRSFLQETESTPRNFLMYCLEDTVFLYTWIKRHLIMLTSRASFF